MEEEKIHNEEIPAEIHSFRFSENDIEILYKKVRKPIRLNFFVWLAFSLLFIIQITILKFVIHDEIEPFVYFAFGMSFTLTIIYFATLRRHKKSWGTMKEIRLMTECHYEIYGDCIILRLIRDDKLYYLRRIKYSDIKSVQIFPDHYSFIHANEQHIIFKKYLKKDSLIPKIFENTVPAQKTAPRKQPKTSPVIAWLLFFAALLAPIGAYLCTSLLGKMNGASFQNMWTFFAFLIFPIASFVYGLYLSSKKENCVKNIVIGILISLILCLFGSFTFLDTKSDDPNTEAIQMTETTRLYAERADHLLNQ
ncbi:MAG: hypothetical protein IJ489_03970 [Clostridia bacterium]|nr:hypothetical protein [Clostridia bacterium]